MGKFPLTIINDQDPTIKSALQEVFPQSFHRFCKWYITNKMSDKIGKVYKDKVAMEDFFFFLNHSNSIKEFDNR